MHWYGCEGEYNALVLDYLGESLEDLFTNVCHKKFTIKTTLMIGDQMIERLELFHKHNMLHNDVKPDNFLMGQGKKGSNVIHIIDFGLACSYLNL